MATNERARLIFHGAIVMLVGLLCGLPAVTESGSGELRQWHTAHEALIMVGVWLLAMSSVLPALVLERREASGLIWSLLAMGYGLTIALVVAALGGVRAFEPGTSPASIIAFSASNIGILGSVVATALTLMGARAGHRTSDRDPSR
jgi:hypothetical protein